MNGGRLGQRVFKLLSLKSKISANGQKLLLPVSMSCCCRTYCFIVLSFRGFQPSVLGLWPSVAAVVPSFLTSGAGTAKKMVSL